MFIAYLWGIETQVKTISEPFKAMFIAYLWGIETYSSGTDSIRLWTKFIAYLWGIETPGQIRMDVPGLCL